LNRQRSPGINSGSDGSDMFIDILPLHSYRKFNFWNKIFYHLQKKDLKRQDWFKFILENLRKNPGKLTSEDLKGYKDFIDRLLWTQENYSYANVQKFIESHRKKRKSKFNR
jgi:hypothetical protein